MSETPPHSLSSSGAEEPYGAELSGHVPEAAPGTDTPVEDDLSLAAEADQPPETVAKETEPERYPVEGGRAATSVTLDRKLLDLLRREEKLLADQRKLEGERRNLLQDQEKLEVDRTRLEQDRDAAKKEFALLHQREEAWRLADADLTRRLEVLLGRERDADAGFSERHRKEMADLEDRWAQADRELRDANEARRASLRQELEAESVARQQHLERQFKADAARLDAELGAKRTALAEQAKTLDELRGDVEKERLAAVMHLTRDLARRRDEAREALEQELEARRAEAQQALVVRDEALRKREAEVAAREAGLEAKARETDIERDLVKQERAAISAHVRRLVEEEAAQALDDLKTLRKQLETVRGERQALMERLEGFKDLAAQLGGLDPAGLARQRQEQAEEVSRLREELGKRPSEAEWSRLKSKESEIEGLHLEMERLRLQNHTLLSQQGKWVLAVDELERHKELETAAKRRRDALEAEFRIYDEKVKKVLSLLQQPQERQNRVEVIEQPIWSGAELTMSRGTADLPEIDWLTDIEEACAETGIVFPRRLLKAFHTSLKTAEWSPLTVLAGVSGTGKSELPRLYARYGGLLFESMPVQPNWDSPQSMLGFFNTVDNRFNATRLLRALVQSQKAQGDGGASDALLLVLLDEMNLAHIEMYFADFLSKLELRRGLHEDVNLEVDIGAGIDRYTVPLGRNVLWVGTMNEDETTKSLSDKVVDRGNVLGFPRPRELRRRPRLELGVPANLLPRQVWQRWQAPPESLLDEEINGFRETLQQLNEYMNEVGRALGHRVWQAVDNYMANHPDVLANPRDQEGDGRKRALQLAFEDALVHKVMPKLRGIETSGDAKFRCLDPIRACLQEKAPGLQEDFELATRLGLGVFVWASARYLDGQGEG